MFCRSSPVYIWHVDRLKPDVRYHRALLSNPSSSSSSSSFSASSSYLPVSPLSLLLSPTAPSCFSPLAPHTPSSSRRCLGPFMKAALIWGNQYLLNVEGQGRCSVVVTGSGLRRGACMVEVGAGVWEGEGGRGDMLLDKREPIDLFSARVCVSIGPLRLLGAWLTGSETVRILRCGLSLCVCLCVCNWGHVTLIYKLYMRGLLHYS